MRDQTTDAIPYTSSWKLLVKSVELIKSYIEPVIFIGLLPILTFQLGGLLNPTTVVSGRIVYLIGLLWLIVSTPALLCLELRAARKEPVTVPELYRQGLHFSIRLFGLAVLTGLLIIGGFILLVVPGILLLRRYALAPYYLIDTDCTIREAMYKSATNSKQAAGYIYGIFGVIICVSIITLLLSLSIMSIPGASEILTSALSLSTIFLFALRYVEVEHHTTRVLSSDS